MDERRDNCIMKLKLMEDVWVVLFSAEEIETLLSSSVLIDKMDEYRYTHRGLGIGILNRFVFIDKH